MKKSVLVAVPLVAAIGLGSTWYAGKQVEAGIKDQLKRANGQLGMMMPGLEISLKKLERGFFSTDANYALTFSGVELEFTEHFQHGPFPLGRLTSGKFMPAMAYSHFELVKNDLTAPAFELFGQNPLSGQQTTYYNGSVTGSLIIPALDTKEKSEVSIQLSPLNLEYSLSKDMKDVYLDGKLAELKITGKKPEGTVTLSELTLTADKKEDGGLSMGPSALRIKSLKTQIAGKPEIEVQDIALEELTKKGEKGIDVSFGYSLGQLLLNGKKVVGSKLVFGARNLDAKVLLELQDLSQNIASGKISLDDPVAFGMNVSNLLMEMMKSGPQIALDEASLQTGSGEAKASLVLDLRAPDMAAGDPEKIALSALTGLQLNVKIDKAVIGDLLKLKATTELFEGKGTGEVAQEEVAALTEMFSTLAVSTQWMIDKGSSLDTSLHYADNKVTFNGKEMSLDEFKTFAIGSAAMMGGAPEPQTSPDPQMDGAPTPQISPDPQLGLEPELQE